MFVASLRGPKMNAFVVSGLVKRRAELGWRNRVDPLFPSQDGPIQSENLDATILQFTPFQVETIQAESIPPAQGLEQPGFLLRVDRVLIPRSIVTTTPGIPIFHECLVLSLSIGLHPVGYFLEITVSDIGLRKDEKLTPKLLASPQDW